MKTAHFVLYEAASVFVGSFKDLLRSERNGKNTLNTLPPPKKKQKSQESNRTSPIYLICIEIQAYGYMSHYEELVNHMKDFSVMQTS